MNKTKWIKTSNIPAPQEPETWIKIANERLVTLGYAKGLRYTYKGRGRPRNEDYELNDISSRERKKLNDAIKFFENKHKLKVAKRKPKGKSLSEKLLAVMLTFFLSVSLGTFIGNEIAQAIDKSGILEPRVIKGVVNVEEPKVDTQPVMVVEKSVEPILELSNINNWQGIASWYGEDDGECLGCHPQLIMANGKRFDETKYTVAFNWLPLGSKVQIRNLTNGLTVVAEVTDTGGFNELGRIIDLSEATKDLIECKDLCEVEVTEVL